VYNFCKKRFSLNSLRERIEEVEYMLFDSCRTASEICTVRVTEDSLFEWFAVRDSKNLGSIAQFCSYGKRDVKPVPQGHFLFDKSNKVAPQSGLHFLCLKQDKKLRQSLIVTRVLLV